MVRWRSPLAPDGFDCRIDSLSGDVDSFRAYHERTRGWSPFNYELFARVHRRGGVVGVLRGERLEFHANGTLTRAPLDRESRQRFLVEELGLDEAFRAVCPTTRQRRHLLAALRPHAPQVRRADAAVLSRRELLNPR